MAESTQSPDRAEREVQKVAPRERMKLEQALMGRFAAYLRPGESLTLDAEKAADFVFVQLELAAADKSFELTLEAAILSQDQGEEALDDPQAHVELALEFLKMQLYEYFRSDRAQRFHIDWQLYPVERATIRFHGELRRPKLDAQADRMLDADDTGGLD